MREIGEAVGLTSSSSVAHQLKVLEEKGFLKPRPQPAAGARGVPARGDGGAPLDRPRPRSRRYDETGIGDAMPPATYVPMLGRIAAGGPILAEENLEEVFPLPQRPGRRRPAVPARGHAASR